jgi:curved DNA-binding protein CbpA
MSRHLASFRWHIPYRAFSQHHFVNVSRAPFIHPRYFSSFQSLRKTDHYAVLGVSRNASAEEIQEAFLRASKQKHPDVNKSPNAHAKFQAILEAKEVLTDSLKGSAYGVVWAKENADRIAAEKLRRQQEEEMEREERRLAKNLEKQRLQEKEEAERKANKRTKPKATSRAEKLQRAKNTRAPSSERKGKCTVGGKSAE